MKGGDNKNKNMTHKNLKRINKTNRTYNHRHYRKADIFKVQEPSSEVGRPFNGC